MKRNAGKYELDHNTYSKSFTDNQEGLDTNMKIIKHSITPRTVHKIYIQIYFTANFQYTFAVFIFNIFRGLQARVK